LILSRPVSCPSSPNLMMVPVPGHPSPTDQSHSCPSVADCWIHLCPSG
jgi:hypothetical protein